MSVTSVLTKVQKRVDDDKTALQGGNAAAADLPAAQAVLADITNVRSTEQSQGAAATARFNAAKAAATAATATITPLTTALSAAPFNLTAVKKGKLTTAVTAATYGTVFADVQTSMKTLATDSLAAADAQIDLAASRQKVMARVTALTQWVAVAETAIGQVGPLVQQANTGIGAKDLARAWWAITQANSYLAVVTDAATATAVTAAITALTNQADAYAAALDASLTAETTVSSDLTALAARQAALAANTASTGAALAVLVNAGL